MESILQRSALVAGKTTPKAKTQVRAILLHWTLQVKRGARRNTVYECGLYLQAASY
jgi:hypothetical protein